MGHQETQREVSSYIMGGNLINQRQYSIYFNIWQLEFDNKGKGYGKNP